MLREDRAGTFSVPPKLQKETGAEYMKRGGRGIHEMGALAEQRAGGKMQACKVHGTAERPVGREGQRLGSDVPFMPQGVWGYS